MNQERNTPANDIPEAAANDMSVAISTTTPVAAPAVSSGEGTVSPGGTDGNGGDPGNTDDSWGTWFIENNPLYLISVFMMFLGLHLVSREATTAGGSVGTVLAFFGVQNLYEIIMVSMSLYLLTAKINARHGKILLVLVFLFLADLTFYQVRIAAMSATAGFWASLIYLALAVVKIAAVVRVLSIQVRWERLIYPLSVFAVIYFAPQYLYWAVDAIGRGSVNLFSGVYEIYMIWLAAAAIHLPVIVANWKRGTFDEPVKNEYIGDETPFYRWLLFFPFVVLPIQLVVNVMNDASAGNSQINLLGYNLIPYLLVGLFFVQALWRSLIEREWGIGNFDFVGLMVVCAVALISESNNEAFSFPFSFNRGLLVGAHVLVATTRQNFYSMCFLGAAGAWYSLSGLTWTAGQVVDYGRNLSRTAWAAILMAGSFISLLLGFLVSLSSRQNKPRA